MSRHLSASILALSVSFSPRALAQAEGEAQPESPAPAAPAAATPSVDDIKAAEADFAKARAAYKEASYAEAAEYFESADSHAPNDRVIELAIGAREKAGQIDRAATVAQLALDRHPESERIKKVAEPLITRAKAEFHTLTIECSEACSLLDGTRIVHGAPSMLRTVYLSPGEHTIRAGWSEDRSLSETVRAAAGESGSIAFTAPPIPEKPPEPPPKAAETQPKEAPPTGLPPIYFWIGVGATGVLGGVTVWSAIDTKNNPGADTVRRRCAGLGPTCPEYEEGLASQLRTNILIAATGVVGVATAVVGAFATNWRGDPDEKADAGAAGVTPWVGVDGGGRASVGAIGRF